MHKSKFWAFVLSFMPGVGHYYLGLMQRGLQFNLLFFGVIFVMAVSNLGLLGFLIPVLWFYALFDALLIVNKLEQGLDVPDTPAIPWNRLPVKASILGWVLVFLGAYSFVMVNPFFHLRYLLNQINAMLAAAALIIFGVYLLLHPDAGRNGKGESAGKGDDLA